MTSGIYAIRNRISGKLYIGSAVRIEARWAVHRHELERGTHHSRHLQRSWDKHRASKFVFEILEIITNPKRLVRREQHWMDTLNPQFNIHPNARSPLGVKRSEATRAKLRAVKRPWLAERNKTPKMRAASRARAIERNKTAAMRAAVSSRVNPVLGYKHTHEAIEKIRASKIGKKRPDLKRGADGKFIRL